MSMKSRSAFAVIVLTAIAGTALADEPASPAGPPQNPQPDPAQPPASTYPPGQEPYQPNPGQPGQAGQIPDPNMGAQSTATPPPEDPKAVKEPKRGDFDAGGQVRLPNGPDEMGQYATFNWIALDLKAKYYLLKSVTVNGNIPLAVKKPDTVGLGTDPKLIGGMTLRLDAMLPAMPKMPFIKYETEVGLSLTAAYMREGAMLLSEKDFPLFLGDFQPGFAGGLITKVKLSSVIDFSLIPSWVYQKGTAESLTAVQIPMSLIVKLGSLIKVSADLGIFTGDNYSFGGSNGGRIATGGSLTVKLGPILAHAGVGVASLLTGGLYPTIGDSMYIDLNVKYAK
jgi:hypothetical protein